MNISQSKTKISVSRPLLKSGYHGTESLSYLRPKVWLGYTAKHLQNCRWSRQVQKGYSKTKPKNCRCRIC